MKIRRSLCLLAALSALLGLCACRREEAPPAPVQPFDFYYRAESIDYAAADGLIRAETRDLGEAPLSAQELVELYLQGPDSDGLASPFPRGVTLRGLGTSGTVLTLRLSEEYGALQGVDASIADACIVKTMLGLPDLRRVRITVEDGEGNVLRSALYDADDILLSDDSAGTDTPELTLYFADAEGRYLLTEKQRTATPVRKEELPQYLLERLIEGPQTAGLHATIPVGTVLLDVNVENGICAVDLNAAFVDNRSDTGIPPHLALLSIVNTLTELDAVDQVQFYIEGRQQTFYGSLPFSGSFIAESRAVGPVHPELREFDGTLCLPTDEGALLYPLTLRIKSNSNESRADALLRLLWSASAFNGLRNPLTAAAAPVSVTLEGGLCMLHFAEGTFPTDEAGTLEAQILIATLCADTEIDAVVIYEADAVIPMPAVPEADWFCQPPL